MAASKVESVVEQMVAAAKQNLAEVAAIQSFKVDKDGKPTKERVAPHAGHRAKAAERAVEQFGRELTEAVLEVVAAAVAK